MQHRTTILILFISLLSTFGLMAQPVLLKDILSGSSGSIWLGPSNSTVAGNTFYFNADDGIVGNELWKSDGTTAGTVLVRDINPTNEDVITYLFVYNNQLYFEGQDTTYGRELWRTTDGPEGAILVRDACPGKCNSKLLANGLGEFQGKLFFRSYDEASKEELWVSDGTSAGTQLFKDINAGGSSFPSGFKAYKDKLFFIANSFSEGYEPWYTDGTPAGTHLLNDIFPGLDHSNVSGYQPTSNGLYFFADDDEHGYELWKTDGTSAGTVLVKNIAPGNQNGIYIYASISNSMELNGNLLFDADDGINGREL